MFGLVLLVSFAGEAKAATFSLPLTGSKWSLYDYGGTDKCGVSTCGANQYPGTLPNNGGVYFNFPNAADVPAGGGGTSTTISSTTFTGTGLNDANWNNSYYSGPTVTYCATISYPNAYSDGAGYHDEVKWGTNGSCTNGGTTYIQSLDGVYLSNGVLITFAHYAGHTLGDTWTVTFTNGVSGTSTLNTDWRGYFVTQPSTKKFTGTQTLTMTVQVVASSTTTFGYHSASDNTCSSPATIRPYFQSGALYSTTNDGGNRWWANPGSYVLADGTVTLSIPLKPQYWSSTYGQKGDANATMTNDFNKTIGSVGWIGATMGGGCFFGHGVNASGSAQLILKSYTIQ